MQKRFFRVLPLLLLICIIFTACYHSENNKDITEATGTTEKEDVEMTTTKELKKINLKIGTYNIANGREIGHDMTLIAQDILKNEIDVVGFQEVDRYASRSKFIDTIKLLSEYTGFEYYTYTKSTNIKGDAATFGGEGD